MFAQHGSIAYGISLTKYAFEAGEPIPFYMWADNASNKPALTMTCADLGWLKEDGFHLYDAEGRRVPNIFEAHEVARWGGGSVATACTSVAGKDNLHRVHTCLRNFPIVIPAHTCVNAGDFEFRGNLRGLYDLTAGTYTIRPYTEPNVADPCNPESKVLWHGTPGRNIMFEISPP